MGGLHLESARGMPDAGRPGPRREGRCGRGERARTHVLQLCEESPATGLAAVYW